MKIAINALSVSIGGGLTYLLNIFPQLSRIDKENEYLLLVDRVVAGKISREVLAVNFKIYSFPKFNVALRIIFEQLYFPWFLWRKKVDLLYSPADITVIFSPTKSQLLAMRNPSLYTDLNIKRSFYRQIRINILKTLARISARRVKRIISVSESWKKLIAKKTGVPKSKIITMHHGISDKFLSFEKSCPEKSIGPMIKNCLLSVSTIYVNKNFVNLIKAFALLIRMHGVKNNLVIIGKNCDAGYYLEIQKEIKNNGLEKRVLLLNEIDYYSLVNYYRQAMVFVFPSFMETFGHPLLEAMFSKLPIAASDIPVFNEICVNAAIYFNPYDPVDMAEKINKVIQEEQTRENLIKNGSLRVKDFSWENTARKLLATFKAVHSNSIK